MKNPHLDISPDFAFFFAKLKEWEKRIDDLEFKGKDDKKRLRDKINEIYDKFSGTNSWDLMMKRALKYEKTRKGIHTKFVSSTDKVGKGYRSVIAFKSSNKPKLLKEVTFNEDIVGSKNEFYKSKIELMEDRKKELELELNKNGSDTSEIGTKQQFY